MGNKYWFCNCHTFIGILLLVELLICLFPVQAKGASTSSLLHNSDQFACNLSIYNTETDCTSNGGTWTPDRKWAGGWGSSGIQYGKIDCGTCHERGSGNIKFISSSIIAVDGSFPGGATVSTQQAVPGVSSDFGDDSDAHTSSTSVCETCHSQTRYHRYDTSAQLADGGSLDHFNSVDCISCHRHEAGFRAGCSDCHGNSVSGDYWPDGLDNNLQPAYVAADDSGSHLRHIEALGGNSSCGSCHPLPQAGNFHLNDNVEVLEDFFSYTQGTQTCSNISCHGNTEAQWGSTGCLGCHGVVQGTRAVVGSQFAGNSHHIQGVQIADTHCYQCHWESNSDGTIAATYHGGTTSPSAIVDLVIYDMAARPVNYALGTSAIQYTADGSRTEISKLNTHCLGCHSDQNSTTEPFGDGKTPQEYAWDGSSVDNRYSQTDTTSYGKYTATTNAAQKIQTKAYSAHGQATLNQGGWSATTGIDGVLPNTRGGTENVVCFDCHNSHGSEVSGTTTSYASATTNGGILKDVQAGLGGSSVTYQPTTGGTAQEKNQRNPGADLCIDCHLTADGTTVQPWGYQTTFGATKQILGYYDPPEFASTGSGQQTRYAYKSQRVVDGGHFGASSALDTAAMGAINGLCTPCHDPHGVSTTLGADQVYGVPLLKGTWLTSPYREDVAPATNSSYTAEMGDRHVYLDQNTFGTDFNQLVTGFTESEAQFAGLCLNCHPKSSLTTDGSGTANVWLSKDRIHEAVKGWKTSSGTVKHKYSCSKCHAPHSAGQPRLMITNCMNSRHKGRVATQASPKSSGGSNPQSDCNEGAGRIPGNYWYDATTCPAESGFDPPYMANVNIACHEGQTGSGIDQQWNSVTPWGEPVPVVYGTIRIAWNDCENIPANAPGPLDSASWTVRSGSYGGTLIASGNNGGAGWSGIDDITVPVSGTAYFVSIDWSWDDGNEVGTVNIPDVLVSAEGQIVHLSY